MVAKCLLYLKVSAKQTLSNKAKKNTNSRFDFRHKQCLTLLKTTAMRTKTTFSTNFWLQSSRVINNEALVYARITVNQKRLNISLKKKSNIS